MNMRAFSFAGALAFCAVAQAKTVAWYRFEEEPCGTVTTGETTFTNALNAAKYPAYARVMTANGNMMTKPISQSRPRTAQMMTAVRMEPSKNHMVCLFRMALLLRCLTSPFAGDLLT